MLLGGSIDFKNATRFKGFYKTCENAMQIIFRHLEVTDVETIIRYFDQSVISALQFYLVQA